MGLHVLTWTTGCRVGTTTPIAQWKKSVRENLEKIVTQRPLATGKSVRENIKLPSFFVCFVARTHYQLIGIDRIM